MAELADRVQALVDRYHDGDVKKAAQAIGLAQPTLHRIVIGKVTNPRLKQLNAIAAYYSRLVSPVTLDWLQNGTGDPPSSRDPFRDRAEMLRWMDLVLQLELQGPVADSLLRLPEGIENATRVLGIPWENRRQERPFPPGHPTGRELAPPPKLLEAVRLQYLSWTRWLEDWIEAEGVEKVWARLLKNPAAVSKRFAPARFIPTR
jgi:transcriptional regulator with XRE-family HTH domain